MNAKDRQEIKQIVIEAVRKALTVGWTIERRRDAKTGLPLATPEINKEEVYLPSVIAQMLPYHEGALRGLQADVAKHNVSAEEIRRLVMVLETAWPVLERLAMAMDRPRAELTSEGIHQ